MADTITFSAVGPGLFHKMKQLSGPEGSQPPAASFWSIAQAF